MHLGFSFSLFQKTGSVGGGKRKKYWDGLSGVTEISEFTRYLKFRIVSYLETRCESLKHNKRNTEHDSRHVEFNAKSKLCSTAGTNCFFIHSTKKEKGIFFKWLTMSWRRTRVLIHWPLEKDVSRQMHFYSVPWNWNWPKTNVSCRSQNYSQKLSQRMHRRQLC